MLARFSAHGLKGPRTETANDNIYVTLGIIYTIIY